MLNINKNAFKKIKKIIKGDIEEDAVKIRKAFSLTDEKFSIFSFISSLDTRVILHKDKNEGSTRYITFKDDDKCNYMVLSASREIEEMRFDTACMLKKILKIISKSKNNSESFNVTVKNDKFSREEKHFACALLMPLKDLMKIITKRDKNGKFLYLNNKKEISLKNVNIIADYFGIPYGKCLSRIYHVFETLREKGEDFYIEGCHNKEKYKKTREDYLKTDQIKDLKEVVTNIEANKEIMRGHLLDSLHYREYSKLSDIAKRRLLINLAEFDSFNEGVVKSEKEAKDIINNYISSGGRVYDGILYTKEGSYELSDDQLMVIGEYEVYSRELEKEIIEGIAKANPRTGYIVNMGRKEAIENIGVKEIENYICYLHKELFAPLSFKRGEQIGGSYRRHDVHLAGTGIETATPNMIKQLVQNVSWRLHDVLKKDAYGKMTNNEYISAVNECIYDLIRIQPFSDGNKRTARLLSNLFYKEKGIPFVLVSTSKWNEYVNVLEDDNYSLYDRFMKKLIFESYGYFFGGQSLKQAISAKNENESTIAVKVGNKRR